MIMTKERKQELINLYKREENDTGSSEVQIALLTERISELTEHLKAHKNDNHFKYFTIDFRKNQYFFSYLFLLLIFFN